jgi:hypothetical protein
MVNTKLYHEIKQEDHDTVQKAVHTWNEENIK